MWERRVSRRRGLFALAGAVALLAVVAAPLAAGADPLAQGTVSEKVPPGGNWLIQNFTINSHGNSQTPISVVAPNEKFQFTPSSCSGSFTDPKLGGTTVYGVGPVVPGSYSGSSSFKVSYYGYSVHKGGPAGADFSDVWGLGPYWAIYCAIPSLMSPPFAVDTSGSSVTFGV
jgi:hypothetical protein